MQPWKLWLIDKRPAMVAALVWLKVPDGSVYRVEHLGVTVDLFHSPRRGAAMQVISSRVARMLGESDIYHRGNSPPATLSRIANRLIALVASGRAHNGKGISRERVGQ